MRNRWIHWTAFVAIAAIVAFSGAAAVAAEGLGDPHADGERGNPHLAAATGNPRVTAPETVGPGPTVTSTAQAAQPATATQAAQPATAAENSADPPQTGKPANGTVGNADGKSPKGQTANDKNRGYECDDNNGIGKGNPAHSACPPPKPLEPPEEPETPETPVTPVITTEVAGVQFTRGTAAGGSLARTGGVEGGLAGAGVLFVLLGATLVVASHRRTAAD